MGDTRSERAQTFITNQTLVGMGRTFEGRIQKVIWAAVWDKFADSGKLNAEGKMIRGMERTLPQLVFESGETWTTNLAGRELLTKAADSDDTDDWPGIRLRITLIGGTVDASGKVKGGKKLVEVITQPEADDFDPAQLEREA